MAVTGEFVEDALLSADIFAINDSDGMGTGRFQCFRDGQAIAGATGALHLSAGGGLVGWALSVITDAIADEDGLGSFNYQWLRNGTAIPEATDQGYIPTQQDVGEQISVEVSYTDGHGSRENVTSRSVLVSNPEATPGDDLRLGSAANNSIEGGAGADTLIGNAGDDVQVGDTAEDATSSAGAQVYRIYQATLGRMPDRQNQTNRALPASGAS